MSYCRSSCDDFKSDVYVIGTYNGFSIMVSYRNAKKHPLPKEYFDLPFEETLKREDEFFDPVDPRFAGKQYNCPNHYKCIEKLLHLRKEGLHIPQHALDRLNKEMRYMRVKLLKRLRGF